MAIIVAKALSSTPSYVSIGSLNHHRRIIISALNEDANVEMMPTPLATDGAAVLSPDMKSGSLGIMNGNMALRTVPIYRYRLFHFAAQVVI